MVRRGLSRDRLVALAHEYVSANGLDALTMRRLAATAEVSPGALYKHFRDKRDLQRAMSDSIFATIDFAGIATADPTVDDVISCCRQMRSAMLAFRDGGRIVADSYAPFEATLTLSSTLMTLLQAVTSQSFSAGTTALVLRSYTTGFVILEQAYLELANTGEWDELVRQVAAGAHPRIGDPDDAITILTGDRDQRFTDGLVTILTGTTPPAGG